MRQERSRDDILRSARINIQNSSDGLGELATKRAKTASSIVPFGISFLDDALNGINEHDLVLISGRTGGGKTQLVTQIARNFAKAGKRVLLFALEAEDGEILNRILFSEISKKIFGSNVALSKLNNRNLSYADWHEGKIDDVAKEFEDEALEIVRQETKTLDIVSCPEQGMTGKRLIQTMSTVGQNYDLIIVDHIHFIDLSNEDDNENIAMRNLLQKTNALVYAQHVPIILNAHIRKEDRFNHLLVPTIDDVYGSSALSKVVTKAVMIAPGPANEIKQSCFPTYMHVMKYRKDNGRTRCMSKINFDASRGHYERTYKIGRVEDKKGKQEFVLLENNSVPRWALNADNNADEDAHFENYKDNELTFKED